MSVYSKTSVLRDAAGNDLLGQGTMTASIPVVIASNQSTLTISGTVTANIGTSGSLALDATLTGGTATTRITDGTNTATVKAASTAAVATDKALVVALSPNNSVAVTVAANGYGGQVEGRAASAAAAVGNPVYIGGLDGSTLRALAVDSSGRLITSPTGAAAPTSGFTFGALPTTTATLQRIEATTYTEQATNAQRSVVSSSASDTSAGVGARTILITYLKSDGTGPFTTTVSMNGTTAVNTTATDICFVEKMEVVTVGSSGTNVGTISIKTTTGGGGSTFGSIGVSSVSTGGDGRTLWAHHYIPSGKTMHVTSALTGHGSNTSQGSGGVFHMKSAPIGVSNAIELQVTDFIHQYGQASSTQRFYDTPIDVAGPARITAFVQPDASLTVVYLFSWDYYED